MDRPAESAVARPPSRRSAGTGRRLPRTQRRAYDLLEADHDGFHTSLDWLLMATIGVSVLATILESVPSLHRRFHLAFILVEVVTVAIFTVEYATRVWCITQSPHRRFQHPLWGRLRYMVTPLALIDLASILPLYLYFLVPVDLRFLRVVRLVRLFKLTHYFMALAVMRSVVYRERAYLGAIAFIVAAMVVVISGAAYWIEGSVNPESFGSIPQAMWWTVVTLTTLGYGDVVPSTAAGKILAAITALTGVAVIALPSGILASGFYDQFRKRRHDFRSALQRALADGTLTERERTVLEQMRETLGLSKEEAAELVIQTVDDARLDRHPRTCPHCGKPLDRTLLDG